MVVPVKRPSIARRGIPSPRSRNSSTATSQPTAPTDSSRCPSSGCPRRPSARRVTRPSFPSGCTPLARWKRTSAPVVRGPRTPSTGPGSNPCARSPTWRAAVCACVAPATGAAATRDANDAQSTTANRRIRDPSRPANTVLPRLGLSGGRVQSALLSPVAQLAEHPAVNRRVVGSSPTRGVRKFLQSR